MGGISMGRPKNSEKYSIQAFTEKQKELVGMALDEMKKRIKKGDVSFQDLAGYVVKTLPIIMNENTQSESDVTMEALCKKALKVNLRIQEANEEGLKEEEDEAQPT